MVSPSTSFWSPVMQPWFGLSSDKLDTKPIMAAPSDHRSVGNAVHRYVEKKIIWYARFRTYPQFRTILVLISDRAGDLRIVETSDDRSAFQDAMSMCPAAFRSFFRSKGQKSRSYAKRRDFQSHNCSGSIT